MCLGKSEILRVNVNTKFKPVHLTILILMYFFITYTKMYVFHYLILFSLSRSNRMMQQLLHVVETACHVPILWDGLRKPFDTWCYWRLSTLNWSTTCLLNLSIHFVEQHLLSLLVKDCRSWNRQRQWSNHPRPSKQKRLPPTSPLFLGLPWKVPRFTWTIIVYDVWRRRWTIVFNEDEFPDLGSGLRHLVA